MCLALAECRGWTIATDDKKAIRVAKKAGMNVISSPTIIKTWVDANSIDDAKLAPVLHDIQLLAQFKPNSAMPEYQWWIDQLAKASP